MPPLACRRAAQMRSAAPAAHSGCRCRARGARPGWTISAPVPLALAGGHPEVGAEIEQIVLDQAQHRIELPRLRQGKPPDANCRGWLRRGFLKTDSRNVFH